MSIEKLPNSQPLLVKPKGENALPGGNEIEVWQTQGNGSGTRVEAYSQNTIAIPDKEGNYSNKLRGQYLSVSEAYGEGQDRLARELADLPLRTDTILAEINGKVVDAKVYDYYVGEDGKTHGAVVDVNDERNYTGVSLDVLRGEYQNELRASHQGEAVLNALDVQNPGISPWSAEAAQLREEASMPTSENPRMFDPLEDAIESVDFYNVPGETLKGDKVGWFKRGGEMFFLIEPNAQSRQLAQFTGDYMTVPGDVVSRSRLNTQELVVRSEIDEDTTDRKPEELDRLAEFVKDKNLSEDDILHLNRYAQSAIDRRQAQRDGDSQASRDEYETMAFHYNHMTPSAKDIHTQYAELFANQNVNV